MSISVIASQTGEPGDSYGPFTVQEGDALIVMGDLYRDNYLLRFDGISDDVNGAWWSAPIYQRIESGTDSWDVFAWVLPYSKAGTVTITLNPEGDAAFGKIAVLQVRASTGLLLHMASAWDDIGGSPFSHTKTLPSANYFVAGAAVLQATTISSFSITAGTAVINDNDTSEGWQIGYRAQDGVTAPTMTWAYSVTGLNSAASGSVAVFLREVTPGTLPVPVDGYKYHHDDSDEVNSAVSKSFAMEAGDRLTTSYHIYQTDSAGTPVGISDSLDGAHTQITDALVNTGAGGIADFLGPVSAGGAAVVTIAPPGSLARVWGVTLQWRMAGGTFSVAGGANANTYSLDPTATLGSLASAIYAAIGVAYLDAGTLTFFGHDGNGAPGREYFDTNHYATSHAYRIQEGVTSVSMTWTGAASSLFQRGYAMGVLLFTPLAVPEPTRFLPFRKVA